MPDLSACYFCGTALDEPLSEYPVVPMTLSPAPEDQKTVVLCSVCRRKLGKVIDAVLDSIEERPIDATVQQGLAEAGEDTSANGDDVDADEAGGGVDAADAGDDDAGEAGVDTDEEPAETEWATAGQSSDDEDDTGEFEVDADDDSSGEDGADDDRGAEHADDREVEHADDEEAREDPPKATDGNGEDDDGPHLSALEYTKVMRLLENRDLPVDREEFKIVATSAYEITPQEYDTVIDAAIDRGLVVEEDGQFVDVE